VEEVEDIWLGVQKDRKIKKVTTSPTARRGRRDDKGGSGPSNRGWSTAFDGGRGLPCDHGRVAQALTEEFYAH